ncbi:glycosyltransferase [Micromonospora sp. FIMYZ51]|uniref:glycosyltransferase n=1 Tax=Micromonospora sp. FIMYZ51 TaxID=3051832 RepID=UPI0031201C98
MSERMPRVAVVADWWWPEDVGGAERSGREATMELARFAEVAIFVPAAVERSYSDGSLSVHAVRRPLARRVHADTRFRRGLEFLSAWLLPWSAARLVRRVHDFRPDVVVAANISRTGPWLPRWARARGLRFVRVFHDLSDTCWRRSRLRGDRSCHTVCGECRVKARIMRSATPPTATSVCVSAFVRDDLVRAGLVTPESSIVGYPLVGSEEPVRARRRDGTGIVIGYIGRISPVKGIEAAIRTAAAYRRRTGTTVTVLAAGEGQADYTRTLTDLARSEGISLDTPGHLPVDQFCAMVDVVVIPSRWMEPFGRVAVEVGRAGRPMLISPLGGLPEAAAVSGGEYLFADFQDPEEAAVSLGALLAGSASENRPTVSTVPTLRAAIVTATRRALAGWPDVSAGQGQ